MTPDRHDDDVARARRAVHRTGVTYGPRTGRRSAADAWLDFSHRYGWRAYALPVLSVITIAALLSATDLQRTASPKSTAREQSNLSHAPVASSSLTLKVDNPRGSVNNTVLRAAALPSGAPYTMQGDGTFRILKGHSPVIGTGPVHRYSIDIENGVAGVDVAAYAALVQQTLSDPRSWAGHGVALQRVDSGRIDFHVTLASALTVRQLCGYTVHVETSCYSPSGISSINRVVLNVARWTRGSTQYVGDLNAYRIYMVNHEDGHALGHQHAHECLPGGLAPVMMQQTFGLRSAATGQLCQANPWPYPPGAKGAPGAEQPDTPQNDEYNLGD
jgi:Protein of unknown function (DUF3152)